MNWFKKLIAWFFGIEPIIDDLKKLSSVQSKQIEQLKGSLYIPVQAPTAKEMVEFNAELAELAKSKNFSFLLHALETEILDGLRKCPIERAYAITMQSRGALQIIEQIRSHLKHSETASTKNTSEDPDFLLERIAGFTQGSKN